MDVPGAELRAMTLGMAVQLLAGQQVDAQDVIDYAKKFEAHIKYGTGVL